MSGIREPVVVIGGGMGGLAAALSLAARHIPVTLVERHGAPGGKMRHAHVDGRAFDAGPTVFTMRPVFEALFARAGLALNEHVTLKKADLLARHGWVGSEPLDLFADIDASCNAIEAFSGTRSGGRDVDAYRRFARQTQAVFETLDAPFMRHARPGMLTMTLDVLRRQGGTGLSALLSTSPFTSLWSHLAGTFEDPRLRQLFARYATYCGSSPFRAPATLMLIAHVERDGVWLVQGGMHALACAVADAARTRGAELRFGCGVERIETSGGRVSGVLLEDGSRIATRQVVFNGDTEALGRGLLGDSVKTAVKARSQASLSAVTRCSLARPEGFALAHHTVFFGADYADEFDAIFARSAMTADPTVYVCAQDRDGSADAPAPVGAERVFTLINAPARTLEPVEIERAATRTVATLARHGLILDETDASPVVASPNTFEALFPASDGALYGRPTHGWRGSFSRPGSASRVPGLHLCGGSVHPGAGVPMAALSGQLAADRVLEGIAADGPGTAAARTA